MNREPTARLQVAPGIPVLQGGGGCQQEPPRLDLDQTSPVYRRLYPKCGDPRMTGVTRLPTLTRRHHQDLSEGASLMELASLAVGGPWSDHPAWRHPVLAAVGRV